MSRRLVSLLLAFLISEANDALAWTVPIKGVDVYGTTQITIDEIQRRFGADIERLVQAIAEHDGRSFVHLYSQITTSIQSMGDFAYAEISPVMYSDKGEYCYVTIDIVDQTDKDRRLKFRRTPDKQFSDPNGLLAAWHEYEETARGLVDQGEAQIDRAHCPFSYCVWGFDHPSLKKYLEIFRTEVPKHKRNLQEIVRADKNETHRALAVLLLAQTNDQQELLRSILPSIKDPSSRVRNNALRVVSHIAEERTRVAIPVDPLIEALDLPATIERSRVLAALDSLASHTKNRPTLIRKGGAKLVQILKLLQPNNHDFANSILKKISGKDFGERNYSAWEQWLAGQLISH